MLQFLVYLYAYTYSTIHSEGDIKKQVDYLEAKLGTNMDDLLVFFVTSFGEISNNRLSTAPPPTPPR